MPIVGKLLPMSEDKMIDQEAIERAAKVIAARSTIVAWENIGPLTQQAYRDVAQAVAEALKGAGDE